MQYQGQNNNSRRSSYGMAVNQPVRQYPGDHNIYLYVLNEWYCYNPSNSEIGGWAMGTVYRGIRCRDGAPVAVKRVKDQYANNPQIRSRARLEASLAFRHPNLVEMIGCCEWAPDYGPIFLLSHFVHGEDIDKYLLSFTNSSVKVEKVCLAICSVLDALDYVHSKGIVHRDVKPSNIMVENNSNIRLMDLGIARMNGGNKFSQVGFIGTPEYSAPEQILRDQNGGNSNINVTTDIYAVGITFYELLTGKNPMACPTDVETLTKQIKEKLPASNMIPRKLMRVIWKSTEKEQGLRYQSALEFKHAIQNALVPEMSWTQRAIQWMQNHLWLLIGFVMLLGIIIFSLLLMLTR